MKKLNWGQVGKFCVGVLGGSILAAIGFNLGSYADEFLLGDKVDIIGMIEINIFNNIKNIQINIKDMRKSY